MPSSTANYHLGGTINIDTGDGGDRLESRVITNIGTAPTTVAAQNVVGGTVAPTLVGANWIWNSAGRQHEHADHTDRRSQDLPGGRSRRADDRRPAGQRRRWPHDVGQRDPGLRHAGRE